MSFYSLVLFLVFLLLTNKLVYFDVLKLVVRYMATMFAEIRTFSRKC